jgi:hypothetical protein
MVRKCLSVCVSCRLISVADVLDAIPRCFAARCDDGHLEWGRAFSTAEKTPPEDGSVAPLFVAIPERRARLSVSSTQIRAAVHQLSVDAAASASASRV